MTRPLCWALLAALLSPAAGAGPPYAADDPEPTEYKQYEIYLFAGGEHFASGSAAAGGLDFNYGATHDLQLTAVLPFAYEDGAGPRSGLGNAEFAAKVRFLHQADYGWDVAVFPRVFLRSASASVGEQHVQVLLPLWVQKDFDGGSTFGGGGCVLNRGGDSRNFCELAWAVTHQFTPHLRLGAELQHQTPDTVDGRASTTLGAGMLYDVTGHLHVLAYAAPGLQNRADTARYAWYASVLLTL